MPKEILTTPEFRASYCKIWKPQTSKDGKNQIYGVTMIFEPDADLKPMKKLAKAARVAKWGAETPRKFHSPFKDGTEYYLDNEKKNPEYKGKIIVNANSYNQAVGVVKRDRSKKKGAKGWLIPITDQAEFYSGCYAIASVTAFAYDSNGNKGVSFGLQNLIKVKNGDPLGRTSNPMDDFGGLDDDMFEDEDDFDEDDDDDDEDDDYEF